MSTIGNPPRRAPRDDAGLPLKERKTVATLLPGDCRWPIGDPQHRDFHFCGKHRVEGEPYCEHHMRQGFQATRPRLPRPLSRSSLRQL